jgi:hypothetical protein
MARAGGPVRAARADTVSAVSAVQWVIALPWLCFALVGLLAWIEWMRSGPKAPPPAPAPELTAALLGELAARVAGQVTWPSPYEAHVAGALGEVGVELRAWLDPGTPLPAGEPGFALALLPPRPLNLSGRVLRLRTRDGVITLPAPARPLVHALHGAGFDEVVLTAGRVEVRLDRADHVVDQLDGPSLERLLVKLQRLTAALGERPRVTIAAAVTAPTCPYCRTPVEDDPDPCPTCATLHHGECLREHGRCTVLGCRGRPRPRLQERA